jgi:hypothetical protein
MRPHGGTPGGQLTAVNSRISAVAGVPGTEVNSTRTWRYLLLAPETALSGTAFVPDFSVRSLAMVSQFESSSSGGSALYVVPRTLTFSH